MGARASKSERHQRLREILESDPFVTDRELARKLGVSVQTIRLDRLELGIPESRERTRKVAEEATKNVRSVMTGEVIGDLVHVSLGQEGVSILEPTADMAFKRTGIVRGHHIFAQANSLAVALVDAEVALTGTASVRFLRPVRAGDRLVAKARVTDRVGRRYHVNVVSQVADEDVFKGEFVVFALDSSPGEVTAEGGSLHENRP
ncbi:MAG: transcription factor FapR [Clostridia bacterium]